MNSQHKSKSATNPGTEKHLGDFLQEVHQEGYSGTWATLASDFMISTAGNRDIHGMVFGRTMATVQWLLGRGLSLLQQNHWPNSCILILPLPQCSLSLSVLT